MQQQYCGNCGQIPPPGSSFCARCGTPLPRGIGVQAYMSPAGQKTRTRTAWWWLAAIVGLSTILIVGLWKAGDDRQKAARPQAKGGENAPNTPSRQVPSDKPVDPAALKEEILNDARKTAREDYISGLQEAFRNAGVEASIREERNGQVVIASNSFKLKPARDEVMQNVFVPVARRNMCTMGFKTIYLRDDGVFGDGDIYPLGCPETKTEKDARLQQQREARQKFVDEMQQRFSTEGMQVTEANHEIVITGEVGELSPEYLRASWLSRFNNRERKNLCGIGFKGIRVRANASSSGTLIPFDCAN